jgi:predicted nucleic acid-binding protein
MLNIVVDTSALIAGVSVLDDESDIRLRIIETTRNKVLYAPESVRWELGNAIRKMVITKRASQHQAMNMLGDLLALPVQYIKVDVIQAVELAIKLRASPYDAYVLQCAKQSGMPLLTVEKASKMPEKARDLRIPLVEWSK